MLIYNGAASPHRFLAFFKIYPDILNIPLDRSLIYMKTICQFSFIDTFSIGKHLVNRQDALHLVFPIDQ